VVVEVERRVCLQIFSLLVCSGWAEEMTYLQLHPQGLPRNLLSAPLVAGCYHSYKLQP
jgi:hypothetical protein